MNAHPATFESTYDIGTGEIEYTVDQHRLKISFGDSGTNLSLLFKLSDTATTTLIEIFRQTTPIMREYNTKSTEREPPPRTYHKAVIGVPLPPLHKTLTETVEPGHHGPWDAVNPAGNHDR